MRRLITGLHRRVHHRTMLAIERRTGGERGMIYVGVAAAAAIVIALIVFDASALGMSEPSGVQRANAWGW